MPSILLRLSVMLLCMNSLSAQTNLAASSGANSATNIVDSSAPLAPGDLLSYSVAEDPRGGAVPQQVLVNPKFDVTFPVSRDTGEEITVNAKDKTVKQLQQEIKKKLDANYYVNATVVLKLREKSQRSGQILIYGSVANNFIALLPGEEKSFLEVILQARPSEFAKLTKVELKRLNPQTGKLEAQFIDVEAIKKDPTKDILIRDGDRIKVDEKNFVF